MKRRLNVFLQLEHAYQLAEVAAVKGVSKSSLVATALANFLAPEIAEQREAAALRRLEQLLRQFERLERDQTLLIEMVALFIRHYLATTLPVAEGQQRRRGHKAVRASSSSSTSSPDTYSAGRAP